MKHNLKILKILDFQISVNYSWFVVFGLLTWNLAEGYFPFKYPGLPTMTYWISGAIAALMLFLSVLLHELTHSLVAKRNGMGIKGITLFFFGGVAQLVGEPQDPGTEFKVAIAGPACSVTLGILFLALSLPVRIIWGEGIILGLFYYLLTINFALAVFNLIPGFPLDGGRILRAYLWNRKKDLSRSTYIASIVGKTFAISLILMGIYLTLTGNIVGLWWIFIGVFLRQAAETSYHQVLLRENLAGLLVRDLMTSDVITIEPSMTIEEAVSEYFFRYHYRSFPVTHDQELLGILSLREIKVIPREEWSRKSVEEVMTRISAEMVLHPDTQAVEALRRMIIEERGRLPVTVGNTLVGILTRRDILDLLRIKTDLGT